jgi:hypothetical protein
MFGWRGRLGRGDKRQVEASPAKRQSPGVLSLESGRGARGEHLKAETNKVRIEQLSMALGGRSAANPAQATSQVPHRPEHTTGGQA